MQNTSEIIHRKREALFAHIHNDPFLLGSVDLEGHSFAVTISYLNEYLTTLSNSQVIPEAIYMLQKATEKLVEIEQCITDIRKNSRNAEALHDLSKQIVGDICALNPTQYLLVPGGWLAANGGHAMIYQFRKDFEGNILFHINNSGSGLEFHEKKSTEDKELYNPVLTYKIPVTALEKQAKFSIILNNMLQLQIPHLHRRSPIKPGILYQDVFQTLIHLEGTIVHDASVTPKHWYTGGQLSGTCAQRVLHQMLKANFNHIDEYRTFIYGFKQKSLNDYIEYLAQNNQLANPKYLSQVKKAIRHNLRLLNSFSEERSGEFLFNEQQIKADFAVLIARLKQIELPDVGSRTAINSLRRIVQATNTYSLQLPKIEIPHHWGYTPRPVSLSPLIILDQRGTCLSQIHRVLNHCKGTHSAIAILEQLDAVIHTLPLPPSLDAPLLPFYQDIDNELSALKFYKTIQELQKVYFHSYQQLIGNRHLTPGMYLAKATLQTLIGHINHQHRIIQTGTCFYQQFCTSLLNWLAKKNQDTVYLANHNPRLDQRLSQLRALHKNMNQTGYSSQVKLSDKAYYNQIIKEHPQIKTKLEEYFREHAAKNLKKDFRDRLCSLDLIALYHFYEHYDQFRWQADFKPLSDKFELQCAMELALISPFSAEHQNAALSWFVLKENCWHESPFSQAPGIPGINRLKQTIYPANHPFDDVFIRDTDTDTDSNASGRKLKRTDNHTQLYPTSHAEDISIYRLNSISEQQITDRTVAERELFHLRNPSETQIDLNMDYFIQHLHHLRETGYQTYLEANLFQPGLLLNKITTAGDQFFLRFEVFIEEGLKYYQKNGGLTQTSLYFLKLSYLVHQYALRAFPEQYAARILDFCDQLNRYLQITKQPDLRSTLHELRVLGYTAYGQYHPLSDDRVNHLLHSYLCSQIKPNPQQSDDINFKLKKHLAILLLQRLLEKYQQKIDTTTLIKALDDLALRKGAAVEVRGKYPCYSVWIEGNLNYHIQTQLGHIYNAEGMAYSPLPLEIITHPVTKQIGFNKLTNGFITLNQKIYTIEDRQIKARFIKTELAYRVQKIFVDSEGNAVYFELISQSKEHAAGQKIANKIHHQTLPSLLTQRDILFWMHTTKNELLLTRIGDNTPYLRAVSEQGAWKFYSERHGELRHYQSVDPRVTHFEVPTFIATYSDSSGQRIINLERYGLSLIQDITGTIQYNWQGSLYALQKDITEVGQGIPCLCFALAKKQLCIVPIQRFLTTMQRQANSEYYKYSLDISHVIPKTEMEKKADKLWQHSDTQYYFLFSMRKNQPIPKNTTEALYLAYLYLGSNQPSKAWEMLDLSHKYLGGLEGQYQEFMFICWIFESLPHALEEMSSPSISNPLFVACQLKALSLVTRFRKQDKHINWPALIDSPQNINEVYENTQIKNIQGFYQRLNGLIYKYFVLYQRMSRDQEIEYTLTVDDKKSLLNSYYEHLPGTKKVWGALGAEWVYIQFAELKQELDLLKIRKNISLSDYEHYRIRKIEHFLNHHAGVAKQHSKLCYRVIDTDLEKTSYHLNRLNLKSDVCKLVADDHALSRLELDPQKQAEAIDCLIPGDIDDNIFFLNFNAYLAIAVRQDNPHRAALRHYCHAVLVSARHIAYDNASTHVPLLCNVLYRLIQAPINKIPSSFTSYFALIITAKSLPNIKITVPELVDVTDELLLSSEELLAKLPDHAHANPVSASLTGIQTSIALPLTTDNRFIQRAIDWRNIEQGTHSLQHQVDAEPHFLSGEDKQKGRDKYHALNLLQQLAETHFSNDYNQLTTLSFMIRSNLNKLEQEQRQNHDELLCFVNERIENASQKQQWQIEEAAGQRRAITINHLLRLFLQNNLERYQEDTGLNNVQILELHERLARYIALSTNLQYLSRCQHQIERTEQATPAEKQQQRLQLGRLLYAEQLIDPLVDPVLSVYQLHADLLLRPIQINALNQMLQQTEKGGYTEQVARILMGGGKSKILLPILAYKKATGNNLVIIEAPESLLRTNYIDLRRISIQYFEQEPYLFEFNRHSNCSAKRLEELYEQFNSIVLNKRYIVTTRTAMQSLELKYLELLNNEPDCSAGAAHKKHPKHEEWQQQILALGNLLNLFGDRGDLIIDEVHENLALKLKLNFNLSQPIKANRLVTQHCLRLYQFLHQVSLPNGGTLYDVIKKNTSLSNQTNQQIFRQLAEALVNTPSSPLRLLFDSVTTSDKSELVSYLLNQGSMLPNIINRLDDRARGILALYKEQLSHLLPHTLGRNYCEHYGPSNLLDYPAERRVLAIPYVANNQPKERSQFANYLETINYTIQSLLIAGITQPLLKKYLELVLIQANQEVIDNPGLDLDNTSMAQQLRIILNADLSLSTLDVENEDQLQTIYEQNREQSKLIGEVLEKIVLPGINIDADILHNNAYNHVDMVRSCQGMSGTLPNYLTFHQRLSYNPQNAEGLDGLIYQALLEKTNHIFGFDFTGENIQQAITALFARYDDTSCVRALIDINATFKGVSNRKIAEAIAHHFKHSIAFRDIKHILYFNEDNLITALLIQDFPYGQPIVLGTSDVALINEELQSTPEERFTIYDQAHTIGTDIKQAEQARALVMADEKTPLSNFFQGVMRLRSLIEGMQCLDLIVPNSCADQTLASLCTHMHHNEQEILKKDNFNAACSKLDNVIRHQIMKRFLVVNDKESIQYLLTLFISFKNYFIQHQKDDLFERYGSISQERSTTELLQERKLALLNDYQTKLIQLGLIVAEDELKVLEMNMEAIISIACRPNVCEDTQLANQSLLSEAVEVQQEVYVEVEVEKEQHIQAFNPALKTEPYYNCWDNYNYNHSISYHRNRFKTLNNICSSTFNDYAIEFSDNIFATKNYYQSYVGQDQFIDAYLKPVHGLLFYIKNSQLECVLLSQQEIAELCNNKTMQTRQCQYWISTTQHTVLLGEAPSEVKNNQQYQKIIEQVRFFNGEIGALLSQDVPISWLTHNTKRKLTFFEKFLAHYREVHPTDLARMKASLSNNTQIYQLLSKDLHFDVESYDFSKQTELGDVLIQEAKALSLLYKQFADEWYSMNLEGIDWRLQSHLSLAAIGFAQSVVQELLATKKLLEFITSNWKNETVMEDITPVCHALLRYYPELACYQTVSTVYEFNKNLIACLERRKLKVPVSLYVILISEPNIAINEYLEFARTNGHLMTAFLIAEGVLDAASFSQLSEQVQSSEHSLLIMRHPLLKPDYYSNLFCKALSCGVASQIMEGLLEKDTVPVELIAQFISNPVPLNFEGLKRLVAYLDNYDPIIEMLIEHYNSNNKLALESHKLVQTRLPHLITLVKRCADADLQKQILSAQSSTPPIDLIQSLICNAANSTVIEVVLQKVDISQTPSVVLDLLDSSLLHEEHLQQLLATWAGPLISLEILEKILRLQSINSINLLIRYLPEQKNMAYGSLLIQAIDCDQFVMPCLDKLMRIGLLDEVPFCAHLIEQLPPVAKVRIVSFIAKNTKNPELLKRFITDHEHEEVIMRALLQNNLLREQAARHALIKLAPFNLKIRVAETIPDPDSLRLIINLADPGEAIQKNWLEALAASAHDVVVINALKNKMSTDPDFLSQMLRNQSAINNKALYQQIIVQLLQLVPEPLMQGNDEPPMGTIAFILAALQAFFNKITATIHLALNQRFTSNKCILFATHTKKEKDRNIEQSLFVLNLALALEDEDEIGQAFQALSKIVCRRREALSSMFGTYSIHTQSALSIAPLLIRNNTLLGALHIDCSLSDPEKTQAIKKKMLESCQQVLNPAYSTVIS